MGRNEAVSKGVVSLGIGFLLLRLVASSAAQEQRVVPCCFEHDGYQGVCVVVPAEGETCASILEYLNRPGTVGKTYCNSSRFRGNWRAVPCPQPHVRTEAAPARSN